MTDNYDDIINLPHHVSPTRKRMSMADRAAQFSPFAALTGYKEAISETERLTVKKTELEEDAKYALDLKQQLLSALISEHPEISVTYFRPDDRKSGGRYVETSGRASKIDTYRRVLVMEGGLAIPLEDISDMDGSIFKGME